MGERSYNILFLCTGNSARSILAEAILKREGQGRFRAFSAGSFPKGEVHPMAIEVLRSLGYSVGAFRSKSWDEFARRDAPEIEFIFTVCDNAAGETCPIWPGRPMTAHWGTEDPAAVEGPAQREAFMQAYHQLQRRISLFLALPLASIDKMSLQTELGRIGSEADAQQKA
jgi:protein-tyrosine-phosphatase